MTTLVRSASAGLRGRSVPSRLRAALTMQRTRTHLAELPDYLLEDIGITRDEAHDEASRHAWDVPNWWRG